MAVVEPTLTNEFLDLLARMEHAELYHADPDFLTHPEPSLEGGTPTIGFGHKLSTEEAATGVYESGITRDEAMQLLAEDAGRAVTYARHFIGPEFLNLTQLERQMVTELAFNIGPRRLRKFLRFRHAILESDLPRALEESKRYYKTVDGDPVMLELRNRQLRTYAVAHSDYPELVSTEGVA